MAGLFLGARFGRPHRTLFEIRAYAYDLVPLIYNVCCFRFPHLHRCIGELFGCERGCDLVSTFLLDITGRQPVRMHGLVCKLSLIFH
jgi:hypothetical protein